MNHEEMMRYWSSVESVPQLLRKLGLDALIPLFRELQIDLPTLRMLDSADLEGVGVKVYGPRKKILLAVADLNGMHSSQPVAPSFLASLYVEALGSEKENPRENLEGTVTATTPSDIVVVAEDVMADEDQQCKLCGVDDDMDAVLCDGCDGVHHTKCLRISAAPEGDWFCNGCLLEPPKHKDERQPAHDLGAGLLEQYGPAVKTDHITLSGAEVAGIQSLCASRSMTWTEAQLTTYLKVVKALGYFDPIAVWRALAGTKNQSQCRKHWADFKRFKGVHFDVYAATFLDSDITHRAKSEVDPLPVARTAAVATTARPSERKTTRRRDLTVCDGLDFESAGTEFSGGHVDGGLPGGGLPDAEFNADDFEISATEMAAIDNIAERSQNWTRDILIKVYIVCRTTGFDKDVVHKTLGGARSLLQISNWYSDFKRWHHLTFDEYVALGKLSKRGQGQGQNKVAAEAPVLSVGAPVSVSRSVSRSVVPTTSTASSSTSSALAPARSSVPSSASSEQPWPANLRELRTRLSTGEAERLQQCDRSTHSWSLAQLTRYYLVLREYGYNLGKLKVAVGAGKSKAQISKHYSSFKSGHGITVYEFISGVPDGFVPGPDSDGAQQNPHHPMPAATPEPCSVAGCKHALTDGVEVLLCDECDSEFHLLCLDPPLREVPSGDWFCKLCLEKKQAPRPRLLREITESKVRAEAADRKRCLLSDELGELTKQIDRLTEAQDALKEQLSATTATVHLFGAAQRRAELELKQFCDGVVTAGLDQLSIEQVWELVHHLGAPVKLKLLSAERVTGKVLQRLSPAQMETALQLVDALPKLSDRLRFLDAVDRLKVPRAQDGQDAPPSLSPTFHGWNPERVCRWLRTAGFSEPEVLDKFRAHEIDGAGLAMLRFEHLSSLGFETVGDKMLALEKIEELSKRDSVLPARASSAAVSSATAAAAASPVSAPPS